MYYLNKNDYYKFILNKKQHKNIKKIEEKLKLKYNKR